MELVDFLQQLLPAREKVPFFDTHLEALYNYIRERPGFLKRFALVLKARFGFSALIIWRLSFCSIQNLYWSQYYKARDFKFLIIFTFDSPSNYQSQLKVAEELDRRGVEVLIITSRDLFKSKIKELRRLKNCSFIFIWIFIL